MFPDADEALATMYERESEVVAIDDAPRRSALGQGSVPLLEGPPGIGKTALLRHARAAAAAEGMRVLGAAASELDRGFPFGLVHQLLDGLLAEDPSLRARVAGDRRELTAHRPGTFVAVAAPRRWGRQGSGWSGARSMTVRFTPTGRETLRRLKRAPLTVAVEFEPKRGA